MGRMLYNTPFGRLVDCYSIRPTDIKKYKNYGHCYYFFRTNFFYIILNYKNYQSVIRRQSIKLTQNCHVKGMPLALTSIRRNK